MTKHETSPVLLGFASTLEFVAEETAAKRISKREIQIYNVNHIVIRLKQIFNLEKTQSELVSQSVS